MKKYLIYGLLLLIPLVTFAELQSATIRQKQIPIIASWINETHHYRTCKVDCRHNESKACIEYPYPCIFYTSKRRVYKTVGYKDVGEVNINGQSFKASEYFCKVNGDQICCIHEREGGEWQTCKDDGSVTCHCINLKTKREVHHNSLKRKPVSFDKIRSVSVR